MLFNTLNFSLFFIIIYFAYWFLNNKGVKTQNLLLIGSSYFFYGSSENGVDRVYEYLSSIWLTNNCFLQSDKLAMGNSIEVRTPFADYNLNSYVKSIDFESKYKQGQPKWFLKEVFKNELPDYILNPIKKGFSPPYNFIDELVKSKKYSSFFNKKYDHFNELVVDEVIKKYQIQ